MHTKSTNVGLGGTPPLGTCHNLVLTSSAPSLKQWAALIEFSVHANGKVWYMWFFSIKLSSPWSNQSTDGPSSLLRFLSGLPDDEDLAVLPCVDIMKLFVSLFSTFEETMDTFYQGSSSLLQQHSRLPNGIEYWCLVPVGCDCWALWTYGSSAMFIFEWMDLNICLRTD